MTRWKEQCARGSEAPTRILRRRFPGTCETVGQVFKFAWRLHWKINALCMSLSPFVSFQSRYVTYLLTFPRMLLTGRYSCIITLPTPEATDQPRNQPTNKQTNKPAQGADSFGKKKQSFSYSWKYPALLEPECMFTRARHLAKWNLPILSRTFCLPSATTQVPKAM